MPAAEPTAPVLTDDDWQTAATAAAISAARNIITSGAVNGRAMVSSLGEIEWGWIVCAAIFGWVETKARQAVAEGTSYDVPIRTMTHREPEPWESGAVAAVLPALANLEGIDWDQPVGAWSREQIIAFAWHAHKTVDAALAARDEGATCKIARFARGLTEREVSAANGGSLLAHDESDAFDAVPPRAPLGEHGDEIPW